MRKYSIAPVVAGILLAAAGAADAATDTTTFTVTATVGANCFVSATDLDFGSYTGVAALTSTADVNVRCTDDWPYTLTLSTGNGTYGQRLLSNGTGTLEYNLFSEATYTNIWGDGTDGSTTVGGAGEGLSAANEVTHRVYGELPNSVANQDAAAGTYTDSITVTITY
jgi:spore coat protein U-like protein